MGVFWICVGVCEGGCVWVFVRVGGCGCVLDMCGCL